MSAFRSDCISYVVLVNGLSSGSGHLCNLGRTCDSSQIEFPTWRYSS